MSFRDEITAEYIQRMEDTDTTYDVLIRNTSEKNYLPFDIAVIDTSTPKCTIVDIGHYENQLARRLVPSLNKQLSEWTYALNRRTPAYHEDRDFSFSGELYAKETADEERIDQFSTLFLHDPDGWREYNHISFSDCKEYLTY